MQRVVCFDITHLLARHGIPWPSGIDKVDLAYGRHFTAQSPGPFVHYDRRAPRLFSREAARDIVHRSLDAHWQGLDPDNDSAFLGVRNALVRGMPKPPASRAANPQPRRVGWLDSILAEIDRYRLRRSASALDLPPGAIYLNVAQHRLEHHEHFDWLLQRPDVLPVFFIHDLLPLDYPEFFRPSEEATFERRVQTAFTYGKAFIVSSEAVRERLALEMTRRNLRPVPIAVAPLPSSLADQDPVALADPELNAAPYFITVGTIEPRKNQLLLLAIWRSLSEAAAASQAPVPKLLIVGGRGWENEQVLDVLERGRLTRQHVIEASGISSAGLLRLIANARALLMPSFAEGYGLPLVEALSIATPVVATDAPVFREVTQDCAIYRGAIDGVGWEKTIQALADRSSLESHQARAAAERFRKPQWSQHFSTVEDFLETLGA